MNFLSFLLPVLFISGNSEPNENPLVSQLYEKVKESPNESKLFEKINGVVKEFNSYRNRFLMGAKEE